MDGIKSERVRGTASVRCLGDKVREDKLRWLGHVKRRGSDYTGRRRAKMELPGRKE